MPLSGFILVVRSNPGLQYQQGGSSVARDENAGYGPRWADVGEGIAAMSRKWGGHWTISVRSAPKLGRTGRLHIVCSRRIGGVDGRDEREQFAGHEYPCSQYATMPSLMLGLLDRLDSKLAERKVEREGQTSF